MDAITFHFLISLVVSEGVDMHLMDVITTYLYGSIDNDIYIYTFHFLISFVVSEGVDMHLMDVITDIYTLSTF